MPWPRLALLNLVWFAGQFMFLFTGMKAGMPPGAASICMQAQACLTILLAAIALA